MDDTNRALLQREFRRALENAQNASEQVAQTYSTLRYSTRDIEASSNQMEFIANRGNVLGRMSGKASRLKWLYTELSLDAEGSHESLNKATAQQAGLIVFRTLEAAAKLAELLFSYNQLKALVANLNHSKLFDVGTKNATGMYGKAKEGRGITEALEKGEYTEAVSKILPLGAQKILGAEQVGKLITVINEFYRLSQEADAYAKRGEANGSELERIYEAVKAALEFAESLTGTKVGVFLGPVSGFVSLCKTVGNLYREVVELSRLAQELGGSCRFRRKVVEQGGSAPTSGAIVAYAKLMLEEISDRERKVAMIDFGREIQNEAQARAWESQLNHQIEEVAQHLKKMRKHIRQRAASRAHACNRLIPSINNYWSAIRQVYIKLEAVKKVDGHSPLDIEAADRHLERVVKYTNQSFIWIEAQTVGFNPVLSPTLGNAIR